MRYLTSEPDRAFPASDPPRPIGLVVWVFLVVFCGFFALMGLGGVFSLLNRKRLLVSGQPVRATVTECKRMRSRGNVYYYYVVRYRFLAMDGNR